MTNWTDEDELRLSIDGSTEDREDGHVAADGRRADRGALEASNWQFVKGPPLEPHGSIR